MFHSSSSYIYFLSSLFSILISFLASFVFSLHLYLPNSSLPVAGHDGRAAAPATWPRWQAERGATGSPSTCRDNHLYERRYENMQCKMPQYRSKSKSLYLSFKFKSICKTSREICSFLQQHNACIPFFVCITQGNIKHAPNHVALPS